MQITECPPTPLRLPGGRTVLVATQRWALERWEGAADPPDLKKIWAIKPKFTVNGGRSCAELAILDHLRRDGWNGVWVSAFGGQALRSGSRPGFQDASPGGRADLGGGDIRVSARRQWREARWFLRRICLAGAQRCQIRRKRR